MTESNAGDRAVSALDIEDVFLVEAALKISRDFNPLEQFDELSVGQTVGVDSNVIYQMRKFGNNDEEVHVLRYFVTADVRVLKPGVKPDERELGESDYLAHMNFVFAADYRCPREAPSDQDLIGAFSKNAAFHVWPYLREAVHDACARMRLPRFTVPMMKPSPAQIRVADPTATVSPA